MSVTPPNPVAPQHSGTSAAGIVATVLGVIALLMSFIPLLNLVAIPLAIVGVILAIVGFIGVSKGKRTGKPVVIVGAVLNVIALVVTIGMYASAGKAIDDASKELEKSTSSSASADSGASTSETAKAEEKKEDAKKLQVTIDSAEVVQKIAGGAKGVLITYTWTNDDDKATSFSLAFKDQVFQNGIELKHGFAVDLAGYDSGASLLDIQPGTQQTVKVLYELPDTAAPIKVELSALFDFFSDAKVEKEFALQ